MPKECSILTPNARFDELLHLPVGANVRKVNNGAMHDIEKHNPQLAGVLAVRPATEYPVRLIPHRDGVEVPLEAAPILWQR